MPVLRRVLIAGAVAVSMVGCSRSPAQPKLPLGSRSTAPLGAATGDVGLALTSDARGALDLGNLEFRAGRFERALAAYRQAAKSAPSSAAPYFGIYMAARKLGNAALADSASRLIAATGSGAPGLSDSAMRALHGAR